MNMNAAAVDMNLDLYLQTRNCLNGSNNNPQSAVAKLEDANNLINFNTSPVLTLRDENARVVTANLFRISLLEKVLVSRRVSVRTDKDSPNDTHLPSDTKTQVIDIQNGKCLSFYQNRRGLLVVSEENLKKGKVGRYRRMFTNLSYRLKQDQSSPVIAPE